MNTFCLSKEFCVDYSCTALCPGEARHSTSAFVGRGAVRGARPGIYHGRVCRGPPPPLPPRDWGTTGKGSYRIKYMRALHDYPAVHAYIDLFDGGFRPRFSSPHKRQNRPAVPKPYSSPPFVYHLTPFPPWRQGVVTLFSVGA